MKWFSYILSGAKNIQKAALFLTALVAGVNAFVHVLEGAAPEDDSDKE
jgi:hypothetical protein